MESRKVIAKNILGKVIESHYMIYEDGRLWSSLKKRDNGWIRPQVNRSGYVIYHAVLDPFGKTYFAHTLVALAFIGNPPDDKHEINHKDLDKRNNHWSNLEWCTHSYNILHARKAKHWEPGRRGFKHSDEAKAKMSKSKCKPVLCYKADNVEEKLVFGSIGEWAEHFGVDRSVYRRVAGRLRPWRGWFIQYIYKPEVEEYMGK